MSRRTDMLGSMIQRELATVIMRDLDDPRVTGMPSITRVKVSPDLSIADVYVTIMGTPGQQSAALNALKHSAGLMRSKLTRSLTLRQAPYLKFHFDEHLKKELAIYDLLEKVRREQEEKDRAKAEEGAETVEGAEGADAAAGADVEANAQPAKSIEGVDDAIDTSGEPVSD